LRVYIKKLNKNKGCECDSHYVGVAVIEKHQCKHNDHTSLID